MNIPFHHEIKFVFESISHTILFGIIPLGMILHISISAAITIVLLRRGMKYKYAVLIVFAVGLSKEIIDCFVVNNTLQKHIKDMCYDMSYPAFLYWREKWQLKIRELKAKYPPKS